MNPTPKYTRETHTHGWLICSPPGIVGIPLNALNESTKDLPKSCVMAFGVAHHFNASHRQPHVVFALATPEELVIWEKEITDALAKEFIRKEVRWWRGVRVGKSSAALFAALCGNDGELPWVKKAAEDFGQGATPSDGCDFNRCKNLIEIFPEWRARLGDVAIAYPKTKWPLIINNWDELVSADPDRVRFLLNAINRPN